MTENTAGTNNIDSLAERAKEMLERVRGPVDSIEADTPVNPAPAVTESAITTTVEEELPVEELAVEELAVEELAVEELAVEELAVEELAVTDDDSIDQAIDSLSDEVTVGANSEPEPEPEPTSRLGALADQAKHSLAAVSTTDTRSTTLETDEVDATGGIDLSDSASADDAESFDAADLGDLIESDLEDLDAIGTTEVITPDAQDSDETAVDNVDIDLEKTIDIDWAEAGNIELPEDLDEPAEATDPDTAEDEEAPTALLTDDLAEDQAVTDLIALDNIALEDISFDEPPEDDPTRPSGLGLSAAAMAGSAAVASITGDDGGSVSELESLDGDIKAAAATRSYTSVPKPEPKVDSDLNDLFTKEDTPATDSKRSYSLLILVLLALAVLLLLWVMSDDADDAETGATDANATSVQPDDDDATPVTTAEPAPDSTEVETTTAAPTTLPEPTVPPTVWNLVGVESGTSQFAELGAPLGLQAALEQTVDADGNPLEFTLFAPSDDAISALTQAQRDALAQDVTAAEQLIDYHFVDQRLTKELLLEAAGGELMTRAGLPIFVDTEDGDIVLNGTTRIALTEFEAGNGNVLVVDTVLQQPTINTVLNLGNIQFEVISSVITDAGKAELQKAVDYFNENPEANALIEGHTDTDGDADANLRLSDRRARAVREFLIEQGIDGSRLVARGFGESEPILVNGVEDKNASRRIEFTLQ